MIGWILLASAALPQPLADSLHGQPGAFVAHYATRYTVRSTPDLRISATAIFNENDRIEVSVHEPEETNRPNDFEKHRKAFEDALEDGIWCDTVDQLIKPCSLTVVSQTEQSIRYRFQRIAADPDDKDEVKYSKVAVGEVTVVRNDGMWRITGIDWHLSKPFEPFLFVKLRRIDVSTTCAQTTNGRTYQATTETVVEGSAAGISVNNHTVLEISEFAGEPNQEKGVRLVRPTSEGAD